MDDYTFTPASADDWVGFMLDDGRTILAAEDESNGEMSCDLSDGSIIVCAISDGPE